MAVDDTHREESCAWNVHCRSGAQNDDESTPMESLLPLYLFSRQLLKVSPVSRSTIS